MKALLVNGSPHEKGCTYTALLEVAKTLEKEGIQTEIFWIGIKPIYPDKDFNEKENTQIMKTKI